MSFWGKLFGKKAEKPPLPEAHPAPKEELIKVYDAYGREMMITREAWRDSVLLGNLESARDDPDQLYGLIVGALNDGFVQDAVKHAERLREIDSNRARSATLLGVVYLQLDRLREAEQVFKDHVAKHGEEGVLVTNLAKVYSRQGETAKADATLWRGLELDPNQENAVGWYHALAVERGGEQAGLQAFQKLAALPGSWRARLWLARAALDQNKKDDALVLYDEALQAAPRPLPSELLMQMSGDLGNRKHLVEALRLTMPHFDVEQHGLMVGNNLIKANLDLGRLSHARAILDQLYALKRPDFQETLAFWDTEISKARTAAEAADMPRDVKIGMLTIEGPIWLPKTSPAVELFPAKDADAVVVCFLGASAEAVATGRPTLQLSDSLGRLTRGIPLFLCEQFHLRTDGVGQIIQPFVRGGSGGFVLSGQTWDDDLAIEQARMCTPPGDYVAIVHLVAMAEPYEVSLRLVRTIDGSQLDEIKVAMNPHSPDAAVLELTDVMLNLVGRHAQINRRPQPKLYQPPVSDHFGPYQLRLEQALAVAASNSNLAGEDFLSGEREIVMGTLRLCLDQPENPTTRLLLCYTLAQMNRNHPQVVEEYREKVQLLEQKHPLPQPVGEVVAGMLAEVFAS